LDFVKDLRSRGEIVVIGISSDKRVKDRKGVDRPVHGQIDRALMVDALRDVDYTLIAPLPAKGVPPTMRILCRLQPDMFVTRDTKWNQYRQQVEQLGTKLIIDIPRKINSTSRILKRLENWPDQKIRF
jgi:bifunctional ADP-heptose synthase (sugar kinase/adenylyltransferase)